MALRNDTPIKDLIDPVQMVADIAAAEEGHEAVLSVLSQDVTTLQEYHEYLFRLKVTSCLASHEKEGVPYSPDDCPLRGENAGCLHALDFGRDPFTQELIRSDDWTIRVFGMAYVLNKFGYEVPSFCEDFYVEAQDLQLLDAELRHMYREKSVGIKINEREFEAKKAKQEALGQVFKHKYIDPIKRQSALFFKERVESTAPVATSDDLSVAA